MVNYSGLIDFLAADNAKFGLLTMQATSTTGRLMRRFPGRLHALFSAEHGFFGSLPPGERSASSWHPYWNRPIHSLYGEHRKPTDEMLSGIERMVVDLCDIGVRCYTYLATLKNTIEACAERGIPVTVLDRQIPLGGIVDGPSLEDGGVSFVAPVDVPLCHGMTPGECALWIREKENLPIDVNVLKVLDWSHADCAPWPNFIPPSPAIRSWDSAALYPMTVFTEAYPAIDCDRDGSLAFRMIGAPWMDSRALAAALEEPMRGFGIDMRPYRYSPRGGTYSGLQIDGILFSVAEPAKYRPFSAGMAVLGELHRRYRSHIMARSRPEWFDRLAGGVAARRAVESGDIGGILSKWASEAGKFRETKVDIYR